MNKDTREFIVNQIMHGLKVANSVDRFEGNKANYYIGMTRNIFTLMAKELIASGVKSSELLETLEKYEDV